MKKIIMTFLSGLIAVICLHAQKSDVYVTDGVAVHGYDVVSYFTDGKPVKGDIHFSIKWNNAVWCFSTNEHLNQFKSNPGRYAPQYGGYCAYGLSKNHKAPTQPDAWTIIDGKLYLNYDLDVRNLWKKDMQQRIAEADKNWPALRDKE